MFPLLMGSPKAGCRPACYELLWARIAAEFCSAENAHGKALADSGQRLTLIFFYARAMCLHRGRGLQSLGAFLSEAHPGRFQSG